MRIAGVGTAYPPHYYDQETLLAALAGFWGEHHYNVERLERLHRNVLVGGRHLALPLERYPLLRDWGEANAVWIDVALDTGRRAIENALIAASVRTEDVGTLLFVTTTGLATPSLDALLMNRMPLRPSLRRVPIFGLGCAAAVAGLARAADLLLARPDEVAVLLSVELCSLTLQREDLSTANLIGTGLFADGAAAAVVLGSEHPQNGGRPRPRIVASASVFYPDTEHVMGWDIDARGFGLRLSADVPDVVERHLGGDVDSFLAARGLARGDIVRWICHPGGPRVLESMERALEIPREALETSWKVLQEVGNLSSATSLVVLQRVLEAEPPEPGTYGLISALGPGFAAELVLLQW
jgi:alkylresorcinol/alkylpyrone synthase